MCVFNCKLPQYNIKEINTQIEMEHLMAYKHRQIGSQETEIILRLKNRAEVSSEWG